ncbi:MAG TPA: sialidase family protein [Candidatus Solibacter sp.]|nr:sialidase family protein [Candidatus Solibacter sp.]
MVVSLTSIVLAPALLAISVPAAGVPPLTFGLTHNLGAAGGEPSIQDDGQGHLYITTPQGTGSTNSQGVLLQRSLDGGLTFQPNQLVGGLVGGSDSDVLTDVTGKNVFIADLFAAATNVLHSTDYGMTFPNNTVTGPEDDREWLTTIGPTVFVTYHDFALGIPLIFISTDNGATFTPGGNAGQIISPTDLGFVNSKCNTLVSKPVADAAGNLYVLTNASTPAEYAASGCALVSPLDTLYMSVSHDGGHTFTTTLVSDVSAAATGHATSGYFAHSFNQLGIDNGGNLYIDTTATLDGSNGGIPLQNYLIVSKDHGQTWSKPIATQPSVNGQVFPSIATGQAGQVAVGYYQGTKPDHRANGSNFQFVIDQTFNATDPNPTFTRTQLPDLQGTTAHPDGICTDGIFCGTPASSGGNRNLADFESMTVDPSGNLEVIIPADSDGTNTQNWFYKQTAGPQMPPGPINGSGTGNQTWVSGSRTTAPPQPISAPSRPPTPATTTAGPVERLLPAVIAAAALVLMLVVVARLAPGRRKPR